MSAAEMLDPESQKLRRAVKILAKGMFMMDVPDARHQMGSPVGVRHRAGQSETLASE
jgi:hypothetical protein